MEQHEFYRNALKRIFDKKIAELQNDELIYLRDLFTEFEDSRIDFVYYKALANYCDSLNELPEVDCISEFENLALHYNNNHSYFDIIQNAIGIYAMIHPKINSESLSRLKVLVPEGYWANSVLEIRHQLNEKSKMPSLHKELLDYLLAQNCSWGIIELYPSLDNTLQLYLQKTLEINTTLTKSKRQQIKEFIKTRIQ